MLDWHGPAMRCWVDSSLTILIFFVAGSAIPGLLAISFVNGRQKTVGRMCIPIRKVNSWIAFYGNTHYSPSIGCKEGLFAPCFVRRLRPSDGTV